jgi:polysaccharide biosynthesis protein PslG
MPPTDIPTQLLRSAQRATLLGAVAFAVSLGLFVPVPAPAGQARDTHFVAHRRIARQRCVLERRKKSSNHGRGSRVCMTRRTVKQGHPSTTTPSSTSTITATAVGTQPSAPTDPSPAPKATGQSPSGGPTPVSPPLVGVYARLRIRTGADLVETITRLRSSGVQFSREDFTWETLEPEPGQPNWRTTDALMGASASQGLQIIPVILGSPSWVASAWNIGPTSPAGMAAYANFVRAVAARYGSRGTFWAQNPTIPRDPINYYDLWNEPYYPGDWANGPNPAGYAQMFKQAVIAAMPVDPNAKFLLEANTSSYTNGAPAFLSAMFNAVPDLGSYAYGLSVHPYANNGWGPNYCTRYTPSRGVAQDWLSTLYQVCRIEDERRILDAHGASNVTLWITEIGWTTTPGARNAVSETEQADDVHTLFAMLRGQWRGMVAGIQWYDYQDAPPSGQETPDGYGLLRANGTAKPSWNAFTEELARGF